MCPRPMSVGTDLYEKRKKEVALFFPSYISNRSDQNIHDDNQFLLSTQNLHKKN